MMAGVTAAFLTGDIFNLYVWFEVLLIGSFGLLVLGSEREQLDGATKYAFLNLIATTLFPARRRLSLRDVRHAQHGRHFAQGGRPARERAAVHDRGDVPVRLRDEGGRLSRSISGCRPPITRRASSCPACSRALLTKVGIYALLRIFLTLFDVESDVLAGTIAVVAALTMVLGAMGALAQNDIRRMLGYMVISGIGMMLAGLALGSATGLSGAVFYAAHSMIVMTALYFLAGMMGARMNGFSLRGAGGLYSQAPMAGGDSRLSCSCRFPACRPFRVCGRRPIWSRRRWMSAHGGWHSPFC
jgi:multicomponent Na+:H+ antiporter subunit D